MTKAILYILLVLACVAQTAVTVEDVSTDYADGTTTGSLTFTPGVSLQNGDLLVCILAIDYSTESYPWSAPSDTVSWTLYQNAYADPSVTVFYKYCTTASSEPTDYTFTNDITSKCPAGAVFVVRGAATSISVYGQNSGSSYDDTTDSAPSVTTTADNALVMAFLCLDGNTNVAFDAGPAWTEACDIYGAGAGGPASLFLEYRIFTSAGATGIHVFDPTGSTPSYNWRAWQIAINPAASGGPSMTVLHRRRR